MISTSNGLIIEIDGKKWLKEKLFKQVAQLVEVSEILLEMQTKYQHLMIVKTPVYGKMLVLDGVIQITEEDEFIYQESMTHIPLFLHANPKWVLIVGGGDLACLREVLKHKGVEHIDLVEIDPGVTGACSQFMPELMGDKNDARINFWWEDGSEFIKHSQNLYDVIIIDSCDPIGPANVLFQTEFYLNINSVLHDDGIVIRQSGLAMLQPDEYTSAYRQMKSVFHEVQIVRIGVPSYLGGDFTLTMGLKGSKFFGDLNIGPNFRKRRVHTKWFSPEMYLASITLPPFFKEAIEKEKWGEELQIDLYNCDYDIIRSDKTARDWARKTTDVIHMVPFGEPFTPDFGHSKAKTAGISVLQLIETSLISAHFIPHWRIATINIFTCSYLDTKLAIDFSMNYFKAERAVCHLTPRGSFKSLEQLKEEKKTFEVCREGTELIYKL